MRGTRTERKSAGTSGRKYRLCNSEGAHPEDPIVTLWRMWKRPPGRACLQRILSSGRSHSSIFMRSTCCWGQSIVASHQGSTVDTRPLKAPCLKGANRLGEVPHSRPTHLAPVEMTKSLRLRKSRRRSSDGLAEWGT